MLIGKYLIMGKCFGSLLCLLSILYERFVQDLLFEKQEIIDIHFFCVYYNSVHMVKLY